MSNPPRVTVHFADRYLNHVPWTTAVFRSPPTRPLHRHRQHIDIDIIDSTLQRNIYLRRGPRGRDTPRGHRLAEGEIGVDFKNYVGRLFRAALTS